MKANNKEQQMNSAEPKLAGADSRSPSEKTGGHLAEGYSRFKSKSPAVN